MYNYERLMFFKRADVVSDAVHEVAKNFPKFETYELGSQMRRAADSIIFNIAEGGSKESVAEMTTYLRHAFGSAKELKVQILKAGKLDYLKIEDAEKLANELEEIGKMINGFMNRLRMRSS